MFINLSKMSKFNRALAITTLTQYSFMTIINIVIYVTKVHRLEKKNFFRLMLLLLQLNYTALIIASYKMIQLTILLPSVNPDLNPDQ
jgi:hypothetical protein